MSKPLKRHQQLSVIRNQPKRIRIDNNSLQHELMNHIHFDPMLLNLDTVLPKLLESNLELILSSLKLITLHGINQWLPSPGKTPIKIKLPNILRQLAPLVPEVGYYIWNTIFNCQPPFKFIKPNQPINKINNKPTRVSGLGLTYDWINKNTCIRLASELFYSKLRDVPDPYGEGKGDQRGYLSFEQVRFKNYLQRECQLLFQTTNQTTTNLIKPHVTVEPYSTETWSLMLNQAKLHPKFSRCIQEISINSTKLLGYNIIKQVGEGSFGKVYEAQHKIMLKIQPSRSAVREFYILNLLKSKSNQRLNYFQQVSRLIYHPNTSILVGTIYPEMTLLDYANHNQFLSESKVAIIGSQLLEAILFLHSQLITHNDIKLDNILISNLPQIRIIDFGRAIDLSMFHPHAKMAPAPPLKGSFQRLSPHQQDLQLPWRLHEDYFGLASVLYSLLTYLPLDEFKPTKESKFIPVPPLPDRLLRYAFWKDLLDVLINPDHFNNTINQQLQLALLKLQRW